MQIWKSLVAFLLGGGTSTYSPDAQTYLHQLEGNSNADVQVPVVLAVMSACPDAILCESVFDQVIGRLGHLKVGISLTYIGSPNASESTYGVTCKHGVLECAGNIQQLCTARLFPSPLWWSFVQCMNRHDRSDIGTDSVAEECSLAVGHKYDGIEGVARCARGERGARLLKESIERTRELNVTKSCTIIINGKQRCIRDGSWYDCPDGHSVDDFVRVIQEEAKRISHGGEIGL